VSEVRHSSVKLDPMTLGQVFANSVEEDKIHPLTIPEIAKEQHKDRSLKRDTLLKGANGMKSSSSKILMY